MEMDERKAREQRQYALMLERLQGFRQGTVPLPRLISDLEGLLVALEMAPDEWIDEFRSVWLDLEVAYALALDRLEPLPTKDDYLVAEPAKELEQLVRQRTVMQVPFSAG